MASLRILLLTLICVQPSKFSGSNLCIEYVRKLCVSNKSVNFCAPFIAMYLYSCM